MTSSQSILHERGRVHFTSHRRCMSRHQNHQRSVGEATPLHEAARAGDLTRIKELIASVYAHRPRCDTELSAVVLVQGSNVNAPDNHKRAPLHLAAFAGHDAAVRSYLVLGLTCWRAHLTAGNIIELAGRAAVQRRKGECSCASRHRCSSLSQAAK